MTADDTATLTFEITNTGTRRGTETAQLYITDDYALMPRPVRELKGFRRLTLDPGQTRTVSFTVGRAELEYYGAGGKPVVEPGTFTLQAGPSSAEGQTVKLTINE